MTTTIKDPIWDRIREETTQHANEEPILASFLHATILNHARLELALSFHLAKLACPCMRRCRHLALGQGLG